jgi:hypothetical protein
MVLVLIRFFPCIDWLTWSCSEEVVEVSDYPAENPPNESQDSRTWRFLSELPWLLPEALQRVLAERLAAN